MLDIITNSKIGSTYEEIAANILRKHGYWAHVMQKSIHGQPVDIIAARKCGSVGGSSGCVGCAIVYLLDVKHVDESKISFTLDRIEDNQWMSLQYCHEFAGLDNLGFAIYFERDEQWYWLSYSLACELHRDGVKSIRMNLLEKFEEVIK